MRTQPSCPFVSRGEARSQTFRLLSIDLVHEGIAIDLGDLDAVDLAGLGDRHVSVDDVIEHTIGVPLPREPVAAPSIRLEGDAIAGRELLLGAEHAEIFLSCGSLVEHHAVWTAVRSACEP